MNKIILTAAVFVAGIFANTLHADTATIGADKDNTLYESGTGALSNGAGQHFVAGRTNEISNFRRRGLISFDIDAAIPAGSTITDVTITLTVVQTVSGAQNIALHRATADWGEGASASGSGGTGSAAQTGDATWLHTFFNTSTWTNAGGDYNAIDSAIQSVAGIGDYTWNSAQLTADVQDMLDNPSGNFGWIVLGNETVTQTAKAFASRQHFTSGARPSMQITYTPPSSVNDWTLY